MSATSRDVTRDQFERLMKARRAATCVRAARQAMAEGRILDAEERLDEACRLDPDQSEARLLLEELQASRGSEIGTASLEVGRRGGAGWSHWVAAGVAIFALAALAFFWPPEERAQRDTPARRAPSVPAVDLPAAVQVLPRADGGLRAEAGTSEVPVGTTGTVGGAVTRFPAAPTSSSDRQPRGDAGAVEPREAASGRQVASANGVAQKPTTAPRAEVPTPRESELMAQPSALPSRPPSTPSASPPPPPSAASPNAGQRADAVVRAPDPLTRAGGEVARQQEDPVHDAALRAETTRFPAPREAPVPDPALASLRPAPEPSDEELIRGTLRRYADAYGRLDASAAQEVWPSVDVQALRRAFDGLESQGLVFERCELRVTTSEATAACRGRANYVPKVGGRGPMSVSRLWVFNLQKGQAGWTITTADAR